MGICNNSKKEKKNKTNYDIEDINIEEDKDKEDYNISNIIEGAEQINNSLKEKEKLIKNKTKENNNNGALINRNRMPYVSKPNIGRSNNEKSYYINREDQNKDIVINKKHKKKDIKKYSENKNNQYLNDMNKEDNKKENPNINDNPILEKRDNNINDEPNDNKKSQIILNNFDNIEEKTDKTITNIGVTSKLEKPDNNINEDDPDDNKKSQKSIKISDDINNLKIFTNTGETTKLEKPDNNNNDDYPNDKENSQKNINISIKNENYNKNYFFGCPLCLNVPYIESLKTDINNNDIFVTYKCKCELKERENSMNLSDLIIEKEPKNECQRHFSKDLIYYCEACKMKICTDCYKEQHNNHEVNNNYLMSEKNENFLVKWMDKFKENFKGYDILVKMYDEYIKSKSTNNIEKPDDNFNIINDNDYSNKINNIKVENEPINLKELHSNGKQISYSKSIYESGFQNDNEIEKSINNKNFNIKNSNLETIIKQQKNNNNQNPNTSIIDNKNINNLNIEESQNINDFRLISDFENNSQINTLNEHYENPKKNSLFPIKEENNEIKNISINEENNIINQEKDNLKHYYNYKTLKGHEGRVVSLIQLESGYLVSGDSDGSIIIWNLYKNEIISKFHEFGQALCLLEFEPNKLLVGTAENNIGLWDLNTFQDNSLYNFVKHSLWVNCLAKIDKNTFASGSNDCKIYVWDYYKRKFLFELTEHTDCILTLIKLNDGRLCSGSADMTIKIWNLEKRVCEQVLIDHKNWIKSVYQLKNGILLSSDDNKSMKIWKNFSLYKSINCCCEYRNFCQIDDNCLACAAKDNVIDLFDLNNYQKYDELTGHKSNVICVIKLKDNKLASCSLDKTIIIWEQKI